MSPSHKAVLLGQVAFSPHPRRQVLRELGIPKSTYYRWLGRQHHRGLDDRPGGGKPPWNRLTAEEEQALLAAARQLPELSCRQLAAWITDNEGFSVSESTVYRILRREGLVKSPEMQLKAGKEYHRKTTGPHQLWTTDASYFRVVGWGYYYLVTVMDDYSRSIQPHFRHQMALLGLADGLGLGCIFTRVGSGAPVALLTNSRGAPMSVSPLCTTRIRA